jgi:tetratricopeptide (TPR) repeat protein
MPDRRSRHEWVVAPYRMDRESASRDAETQWHDIDAHSNLRGPYTAAGELARRLVPAVHARTPELAERHQLVLLSVAPDLGDRLPVSSEMAQLFTFSGEGYPRSWTRRLAHGLIDFLLAALTATPVPRHGIAFENAGQADPLDREFIAILLRRADPARLTLRIASASDRLDEPLRSALRHHATETRLEPVPPPSAWAVPDAWRDGLARQATAWRAEWAALRELAGELDPSLLRPGFTPIGEVFDEAVRHLPEATCRRLAHAHVDSDGTSDDALETRAYARLPLAQQQALHRARAEMLVAPGQAWGALPFHVERAGGDAGPLLAASKECMHLAYYEAALDLALRGRGLLDPSDRGQAYGEFTRNILFASMLLGDYPAVEGLCEDTLSDSTDAALLAHVTYAKAILNARLYPPARRDYDAARRWVERSLAATEQLPPSGTRAVNIAFLHNTMALVEMRKGDLEAADRQLSGAIAYLAREAPERFEGESAILYHNRARLGVIRKRPDDAIADLAALLRQQPANGEAYFERGLIHQRAGRYAEALHDYGDSLRWSPPSRELYVNRAQTLSALGRPDEALSAYDDALLIEPDHVEILTDRACLRFEQGQIVASRSDVERGLALAPDAPRLLCLRGLLALRSGALDAARCDFTRAIELDPSLADAWANRATVFFKQGDLAAAASDLSQALHLREDAAILYNRGRISEALEQWQDAVDDYERALALTDGDTGRILQHRDRCRRELDASRELPTSKLEALG